MARSSAEPWRAEPQWTPAAEEARVGGVVGVVVERPAAQGLQETGPSWALYFPAAQSGQTLEPPIQYVPAGQHAEEAIEPPPLTLRNILDLVAVLSTQEGPQRGA